MLYIVKNYFSGCALNFHFRFHFQSSGPATVLLTESQSYPPVKFGVSKLLLCNQEAVLKGLVCYVDKEDKKSN